MPKYRKKPVVVEAEPFHSKDLPLPFGGGRGNPVMYGCSCGPSETCGHCGRFYIETLEGAHVVSDGDMVVKGIKGEFYPMKLDIFDATYEREGAHPFACPYCGGSGVVEPPFQEPKCEAEEEEVVDMSAIKNVQIADSGYWYPNHETCPKCDSVIGEPPRAPK